MKIVPHFSIAFNINPYAIRLIVFTLLPFVSSAQKVRVIDRSDKQPIQEAAIILPVQNVVILTNEKGEAPLNNVQPADSVIIRHARYLPARMTVKQIQELGYTVRLTEGVFTMDEVVLSANKRSEKETDLPQRIDIINRKQIAFVNPSTTGDLLQRTGKIFLQTSQLGGGSPVLRGFEANKVLMVIDGVRMNNAIYRGGHLQSVITIDPNILERVEIVYGPGSVIYGSDALGGVMHFYTRNPILSSSDKTVSLGQAMVRYATASQEKAGNLSFSFGRKKFGSFTAITYKDIGDLRMGANRPALHGDWGKRIYYASRSGDSADIKAINSNPLVQLESGYSQYDILQKFLFAPDSTRRIIINLQFSNSSDIPRYDRLSEIRNDNPRYAEWYYGPQLRFLGSMQGDLKIRNLLMDEVSFNFAAQYLKESRVTRSFGDDWRLMRNERVQVSSINADFRKAISRKNELRYGTEIVFNTVISEAPTLNIRTGESGDTTTRYPDGGSNMNTFALYATHNWEISKKLIFSQGARLSRVMLDAQFNDTAKLHFPFTGARERYTAVNGNIGLVLMPVKTLKISLIGSTGFRAPNIDDLGKVFDTDPENLIVPNPDLTPEYAYNTELGIAKSFGEKLLLDVTGFYTLFKDAIVLRPFQLNGEDSIQLGGEKRRVLANTNAQKANLYGVQGSIDYQISASISLSSTATYTYGYVRDENVPLDHIPPFYGQTTFRVEISGFRGELFARYNGWKRVEDYSPSGEDNLQYALPGRGMPSWYTLNLNTDYQLNRHIKLQAGVENILDVHYRVFGSGISAPGRNIYIAARALF